MRGEKTATRLFTMSFVVVLATIFLSCASSKTTSNPNYLGDFDPVLLETVDARVVHVNADKPKELEVYFAPRTNCVEVYFRDLANKICVVLAPEHRTLLLEATASFMESAEAGTLADRRPTKKNSYSETKCSISWGMLGMGNKAKNARIQYNYKYLADGNPYFLFRLLPGTEVNQPSTHSPAADIFFSPAELEAFCAILSQENLQAVVDELNAGL